MTIRQNSVDVWTSNTIVLGAGVRISGIWSINVPSATIGSTDTWGARVDYVGGSAATFTPLYTVFENLSLSSPASVQDVNVVGISQLDAPLWTTPIDPGTAPIIPPPAPKGLGNIGVFGGSLSPDTADASTLQSLSKWVRDRETYIKTVGRFLIARRSGDDEVTALYWNRLMHMLNGNQAATQAAQKAYDPEARRFALIKKHEEKVKRAQFGVEKKPYIPRPNRQAEALAALDREEALAKAKNEASPVPIEELTFRCDGRPEAPPGCSPEVNEATRDMFRRPVAGNEDTYREKTLYFTQHLTYANCSIVYWLDGEWTGEVWKGDDAEVVKTFSNKKTVMEKPKNGANQSARERTIPKTPAELKVQQANVVQRLVSKFSSWDDAYLWIMTTENRVSDDLALLILSEMKKKTADADTATSFLFAAEVRKESYAQRVIGLSRYSKPLAWFIAERGESYRDWLVTNLPYKSENLDNDDTWRRLLHQKRSPTTPPAQERDQSADDDHLVGVEENPGPDGWSSVLALSHNKAMHSMNGNIMRNFPNSMSEIREKKTLQKVWEDRKSIIGIANVDPVEEVEQQLGLQSVQGLAIANVPNEMPLRGGIISDTNAYTSTNDLNHPEALMFPRAVRNGAAAALIASTHRLPLYGVGLMRQKAKFGLSLSEHGMSINEIISRNANIRSDQVTVGGFYTSEVAALIRVQGTDNGDSLLSLFLKLQLYQNTLGWAGNTNILPLSCEASKFDAFTKMDYGGGVTLGYNDSLLFGEDCGGATSVLPFNTAAANIYFHATRATVPSGSTPYYIRAPLLMQNDRGSEALNFALLALALGPYPVGLHTVSLNTVDTAGGNAAVQGFIPFSACVHISGETDLHFIIPIQGSRAPPTTQAQANSYVVVRPTSGPTASTGIAADADLDVNYIGGPLLGYDLAEYLYTWLDQPDSPVDRTTVAKFSKQLAELTKRGKELQFATELSALLTVRYPPMVSSTVSTPVEPTANSNLSVAMQNFFALEPHVVTADLPLAQNDFDMYVQDLNPVFWNKIMTGAYDGVDDMCQYPLKNFSTDGSPRILQYLIHVARDYAITAEHVFQYYRQSREMWNSAFTQLNMVSMAEVVRAFFTSATSMGLPPKSKAGDVVTSLHYKVNGYAPALNNWNMSVWHMMNAPRVGFQGVWNNAGVLETPLPSILPDIWTQLFSHESAVAFSPFLSPLKRMTGMGDGKYQVTALGAGTYAVPCREGSQQRSVNMRQVPRIDDAEVWNDRLVWHAYPSSLYTTDGTIWGTSTVASGNIVSQKYVLPDDTVPANISAVLPSSKSNWMPYNTSTGMRLVVGVTAANGANAMTQVMDGRAFVGLTTWAFERIDIIPNVIVGGAASEDNGLWEFGETESGKEDSIPGDTAAESKD
jgi:hypothetical protein